MSLPGVQSEVDAAARYLVGMVAGLGLPPSTLEDMYRSLTHQMSSRYHEHWHPTEPERGSAFRSICCMQGKTDPMILRAAAECGVVPADVAAVLPHDMALWVNPGEVSVRVGEHGRVFPLAFDLPAASVADFDDGMYGNTGPYYHQGEEYAQAPGMPQWGGQGSPDW